MTLGRTAILLTASALLFGGYLAVTSGQATTAERQERHRHLLPIFRHNELNRISIETKKRTPLVLTHREGDDLHAYALTPDGREMADPAKMGEFLGSLEFATFRREIIGEPSNEAAFGLSEPALRVTLSFETEQVLLEIGDAVPADREGVYAKISFGDEPPRYGVVERKFADALSCDPGAYRSPQFLSFSEKEVRNLVLGGSGRTVELRRDPGGFRVATTNLRAARSTLDGIFADGARLRPQVLLPTELALPEDGATPLEISLGDGSRVRFSLGAPCPEHPELLLVERKEPAPLRGCVNAASVRRFLRHFDHPEEARALGLHSDEIDHVILETPEGTIDLLRKDAHFELLGDSPRSVSRDLGTDFLEDLVRINGEPRSTKSQPSGPKLGSLKVKGHSPYSEDTAELSFEWRKEGEGFLLLRADDGAQLFLTPDEAEPLRSRATRFQSRELWQLEPNRIVRVARTFSKETESVAFRDGASNLESPRGFEVDGELSGKLLDSLRAPVAIGIVPELASEAKKTPTVRLSLTLSEESRPRVVDLHRQGNGTCVAFTPEGAAPYLLRRELCTVWETRVASRAAFSLAGEDIVRISFRAGRESLVLVREDSNFIPLTGSKSAKLAFQPEELLEFRAEKLIHFGPATPEEELLNPVLRIFVERQSGAPSELSFGALVLKDGEAFRYARSSNVDATFLVPLRLLEPWRELLH